MACEAMTTKVFVKLSYCFILVEVRQEGGGNSYKGNIGGNDGTCVSVYEGFTKTIW